MDGDFIQIDCAIISDIYILQPVTVRFHSDIFLERGPRCRVHRPDHNGGRASFGAMNVV